MIDKKVDKKLKKKLKKMNIENQADLISLMIGVVSERNGLSEVELFHYLHDQIPQLNLSLKIYDRTLLASLEQYDLSGFVSEADHYLHDVKRTETGSYYTPVEWVRYMTLVSIAHWIANEMEADQKDVMVWLIQVAEDSSVDDTHNLFDQDQLQDLLIKLGNIKIIDIACGAGAFLLECISVLTHITMFIHEKISREIDNLQAVRDCVMHNIFGVDLQAEPLAIYVLCLMWQYSTKDHWKLEFNVICESSLSDTFTKNPLIKNIMNLGGFDVVIGNPPYLGEKGNTDTFKEVRKTDFGMKYYEGKMDYSYFFSIRALEILKPQGFLSYLTTNYFITADGAVKYRKYLEENSKFVHILNLNTYKIFRDALGQHNMIYVLEKNQADPIHKEELIEGAILTQVNYILDEAQQDKIDIKPTDILKSSVTLQYVNQYQCEEAQLYRNDGCISILSDISHKRALDAYEAFCDIKLKQIFNINQGIVSGADQVSAAMLRSKLPPNLIDEHQMQKGDPIFVFNDDDERLNLIESDLLKPFYKNSDVATYILKPLTSRKIVYSDIERSEIDVNYPKLMRHLEKFRPVLEARREVKTGTRPWYCLQWPRKESVFEGPKIIVPQRSQVNRFAYTDIPFYSSADVYYFKYKFDQMPLYEWYYYLGLLNSSVIYLWLYHYGKRKGELLELYSKPLLEISVPQFKDEDWQRKLASKVEVLIKKLELNERALDEIRLNESNKTILNHGQYEIDAVLFKALGLDGERIQSIVEFHNRYIRK